MIEIGSPNWVNRIKDKTSPLGKDFWAGFVPATSGEINRLEKEIGRTLPDDFKEFYRSIGYGYFPQAGGIDSPDEILMNLGAPIYFITGSMTPGEEWANEEDHKKLWLSRGEYNPCPEKFTSDMLIFEGVPLYDLLQVGSDGCCCYHQLNIGPEPVPFRYCLLTDYQTIEDKCANFSQALEKIINAYLVEDTE